MKRLEVEHVYAVEVKHSVRMMGGILRIRTNQAVVVGVTDTLKRTTEEDMCKA